jgi:hypothetical protein
MSKTLAIAFVVGIACIAIAVGGVFYMQRGAHVDLAGKALKVRTTELDEKSSLAVVDFRINNPSDYPFMVRSVTMIMEDGAGKQVEGQTVSEPDAKRVFEGIPLLGQKYNATLIMRDKLPPKMSWDRMVAARFEVPEPQLEARKRLLVRIEEVDGKVVEIPEK